MSKIIGQDDNAKAWSIPEIKDSSGTVHSASSLTARERKAVEAEVKRIKQLAHQDGFKKGQQDGLAAAQQQAEQAAQSLVSVLNALATPLKQVDNQVETELVNLAVSIAKQIVRRELKADPGQVVAVVREALSILPSSSQNVRVYLNPEDAKFVRQIIPVNAGERSWDVVDDPALVIGSCRVETDAAEVDASFESRIATIAAELLGSERSDE